MFLSSHTNPVPCDFVLPEAAHSRSGGPVFDKGYEQLCCQGVHVAGITQVQTLLFGKSRDRLTSLIIRFLPQCEDHLESPSEDSKFKLFDYYRHRKAEHPGSYSHIVRHHTVCPHIPIYLLKLSKYYLYRLKNQNNSVLLKSYYKRLHGICLGAKNY